MLSKKITKESVLTLALLLLTFSTFFMRGMYFEGEQFLYLALFGILAAAVFLLIPAKEGLNRGLDLFVIGITVVYALSLFTAVYFRSAVVEVMKYSACLLLYFVAKRLLTDRKQWLIVTLYVGGVLMSLIGLGAASGAYFISGAYDSEKNLVMSLFQYHNTSAIMLSCVFALGMSLYAKTKKLWLRLFICAGNMAALLTVVFSQSRGSWLLFPVLLILYFWILPKGSKTASPPVLGSLLSALLVLKGLGDAFANQATGLCIGYIVGSIAAAVVFGFLLEMLSKKIHLTKKSLWGLAALLVLLVVVMVLFGRFILPETIINRISEFTMESRTVTERLTFYKNAFSIFLDYPWLGIGGGGWPFVYQEYQSYWYQANSPHSFLLHLMVETGVLGIVVFLFFIITMLRLFVKLLRSDREIRLAQAPLFSAAAVIFIHSMFDIDFSFYTMTTVTWLLLAQISSLDQPKPVKAPWLRWCAAAVALVIAVGGVFGRIAWNNYYNTASYMQTDAEKAYQCASKAVAIDPPNSSYCLTKGNIAFHIAAAYAQSDPDQMYQYADIAKNAFEQGYRSNPRDRYLINELAIFYVNTGNLEQACRLIDQLTELYPLNPDTYTNIAQLYTSVAQLYQQQDDREGIKRAMSRLIKLEEEIDTVQESYQTKLWIYRPVKDAINQAKKIMGQIEQLEEKQ